MALQIKVTKKSVKSAGKVFKGKKLIVTANLKCWNESDNPEVDNPVIDRDFSEVYKYSETETIDQQIETRKDAIILIVQTAINEYKREADILASEDLDNALTDIQNRLVG